MTVHHLVLTRAEVVMEGAIFLKELVVDCRTSKVRQDSMPDSTPTTKARRDLPPYSTLLWRDDIVWRLRDFWWSTSSLRACTGSGWVGGVASC